MLQLVVIVILMASCSVNTSDEKLQIGAKYKITKPLYIEGTYNSLNDRRLSPETARAYITSVKHARRSEVIFQVMLPVGLILTIVSPPERVLHIPYIVDTYIVELTPDLSQGLDVVFSLDPVFVGDMDGLNSQIFERAQ